MAKIDLSRLLLVGPGAVPTARVGGRVPFEYLFEVSGRRRRWVRFQKDRKAAMRDARSVLRLQFPNEPVRLLSVRRVQARRKNPRVTRVRPARPDARRRR